MILVLTIISPATGSTETSHTFTEAGGTIGRVAGNSWVLSHREVSAHHARISFRESVFYIHDLSRNGVSINSWENRLVRERPYPLKTGDIIFLDPFRIAVSSVGETQDSDPFGGESPTGRPLEIDPLKYFDPVASPRSGQSERPAPPWDDWLGEHYRPPEVPSGPPPAIPPDYDPLEPAMPESPPQRSGDDASVLRPSPEASLTEEASEANRPSVPSSPAAEGASQSSEERAGAAVKMASAALATGDFARALRELESANEHLSSQHRQPGSEHHIELQSAWAEAEAALKEASRREEIRAAEAAPRESEDLERGGIERMAAGLDERVVQEERRRQAELLRAIRKSVRDEAARPKTEAAETPPPVAPPSRVGWASTEPKPSVLVAAKRRMPSAPPAPPPPSLLSRIASAVTGRVGRWFGSAPQDESAAQPRHTTPRDAVRCSVFAPPTAKAGESVLIQVFAHLPSDDAKVGTLAAAFDNRASGRAAKLLDQPVERGTELAFSLTVPGIVVDEPTQSLIWRGTPEAVQFAVSIPTHHPEGRLIATVLVSQNSVPFGHLKFILDIVATHVDVRAGQSSAPDQTWTRYRHAFISYASQDRTEVLKRVQMLDRTGIEYFQDLLSLDPGERWERTLYKKIDGSDVFFLFWSTAAKNSEWVMKEVRYAIERHAGNEMAQPQIVPVMIEGPPPVPPPPELRDLHFNDKFLYFLAAPERAAPD